MDLLTPAGLLVLNPPEGVAADRGGNEEAEGHRRRLPLPEAKGEGDAAQQEAGTAGLHQAVGLREPHPVHRLSPGLRVAQGVAGPDDEDGRQHQSSDAAKDAHSRAYPALLAP